jgi:predicted nucleic-acid-binding protein
VNVTADTNVLVRAMVRDNQAQTVASERILRTARRVVITLPTWCEFVWVLGQVYRVPHPDIVTAISGLRDAENVVTDHESVAAGLLALQAGGDFADCAMAHEGRRLGGEVFVSFDRKAVRLVRAQGHRAELL